MDMNDILLQNSHVEFDDSILSTPEINEELF